MKLCVSTGWPTVSETMGPYRSIQEGVALSDKTVLTLMIAHRKQPALLPEFQPHLQLHFCHLQVVCLAMGAP